MRGRAAPDASLVRCSRLREAVVARALGAHGVCVDHVADDRGARSTTAAYDRG